MKQTAQIILASTSPYRKKLLNRLAFDFESHPPQCDEEQLKKTYDGHIEQLSLFLAKKKALSLKENFPNSIIIGSDQTLILEKQSLGKGKTRDGAIKQLKKLSGKKAQLITAVCISSPETTTDFFDTTHLHFKNLTDSDIEKYIDFEKPFNCAGSFKIESRGIALFSKVETEDPTAIEGFPLVKLSIKLEILLGVSPF